MNDESPLNIERYHTCSILMLWRCICVPPCPKLYEYTGNLVVTSAG